MVNCLSRQACRRSAAMLALALGWAIALAVLAVLAQRWHGEIQHTLSLEVAL